VGGGDAGSRAIIVMQSTGQAGMHSSQPLQSPASTVCMWRLAPRIASTGQGGRQRAQPMQRASSMKATRSGCSMPFAGFSGRGSRPSSVASASIVRAPPGGHWLIGASPRAMASE